MKTLKNLIKGLRIIKKIEGSESSEFNSQEGLLFIGSVEKYSPEQVKELREVGFLINIEYDCFEYNLD